MRINLGRKSIYYLQQSAQAFNRPSISATPGSQSIIYTIDSKAISSGSQSTIYAIILGFQYPKHSQCPKKVIVSTTPSPGSWSTRYYIQHRNSAYQL